MSDLSYATVDAGMTLGESFLLLFGIWNFVVDSTIVNNRLPPPKLWVPIRRKRESGAIIGEFSYWLW
jgi:hypothetical protein